MKHAIAMPIKIRFAFTGFILSFKMSLIINRTHRELIISARGGLYSGRRIIACIETLVYNWGPYKWRRGGGTYNRMLRYESIFSQAP